MLNCRDRIWGFSFTFNLKLYHFIPYNSLLYILLFALISLFLWLENCYRFRQITKA